MKYIERPICYETNSSSQHVFIATKQNEKLTTDEILDNIFLLKNGKLNMWYTNVDEGFGRSPFQMLASFEDKLAYAICEFCGCYDRDDEQYQSNMDDILATVKSILPEVTGFDFKTEYVCPYVDANGKQLRFNSLHPRYDSDTESYKYMYEDNDGWHVAQRANYHIEVPAIGDIDHRSMGMLRKFLDNNKIDLREFLINKKYIIIIDGDEANLFKKMIKVNIINLDNIESIYGCGNGD